MPTVVHVVPGHPLTLLHTFWEGLKLKDIEIQSLFHGFSYIKLLHHGQMAAAEQLLLDDAIKWSPDKIAPFMQSKIPEDNVNFTCKSGEVMRAIIVHQLEDPHNPFRRALEREMDKAQDLRDIEFRVYTNNTELIWSSGLRYGKLKWHGEEEMLGFNVLSHLLQEAIKMLIGDVEMYNPLFPELLSNFDMFKPHFSRSVLIVSDSQTRFVDVIKSGDVVPVSGGKYGDMINVLSSGKFNLAEYKWIVIYCGINCSVKPGYAFGQRDREWHDLKKILVDEAARRDKPSVVFCCSFDHPTANRDNPRHVAYIENQLRGTRVLCVNWQHQGNPFHARNGRLNPKFFCKKGTSMDIHVNYQGLRILWKTWCSLLEGMKFIPYTVLDTPQSVPKDYYKALSHPAPEAPRVSHSQSTTNLRVDVREDGRKVRENQRKDRRDHGTKRQRHDRSCDREKQRKEQKSGIRKSDGGHDRSSKKMSSGSWNPAESRDSSNRKERRRH